MQPGVQGADKLEKSAGGATQTECWRHIRKLVNNKREMVTWQGHGTVVKGESFRGNNLGWLGTDDKFIKMTKYDKPSSNGSQPPHPRGCPPQLHSGGPAPLCTSWGCWAWLSKFSGFNKNSKTQHTTDVHSTANITVPWVVLNLRNLWQKIKQERKWEKCDDWENE